MSPQLERIRIGTLALSIACVASLYGCSPAPAPPQSTEQAPAPAAAPAVTPTTSINELMVTWVDNASHVLWDVEKAGFAPKNDADWVELEDHATQLVAAGTMIQLGGTGPMDLVWSRSQDWKTQANAMANAGKAAADAAKARDLKSVIVANGNLTASCEACHKIYKPEAPTEGIAHQTPHSASHPHN